LGEGDCDTDADCISDLVCYQNNTLQPPHVLPEVFQDIVDGNALSQASQLDICVAPWVD
jgi:hypothetical protein